MNFFSRPHLLFASLNAALLLVGAAAVGLYAAMFPPCFRGAGEVTRDGKVAGWVVNKFEPAERVEVQVYLDGRFMAGGVADLPRGDVVAAGYARDEWCGYGFNIPPLAEGEHEVNVYAMYKVGGGAYRTLQLVGNPLRFRVAEGGRVSASR